PSPIAGADGERRVRHDHGGSSATEPQGEPLRVPFGSAIRADDVRERHALILGDGSDLPTTGEDAFGARVQDALDAGGESFLDHVDCAEVVHLPEMAAAAGPKLRVRRQMINGPAPADRTANGRAISRG